MADQDPNPFQARIPAGGVRDSLDLVWRTLALLPQASTPRPVATPFLARIPDGPVRDSFRLIWNRLASVELPAPGGLRRRRIHSSPRCLPDPSESPSGSSGAS